MKGIINFEYFNTIVIFYDCWVYTSKCNFDTVAQGVGTKLERNIKVAV